MNTDFAIATPEDCHRVSYPTHELAAIAMLRSGEPAGYPCVLCSGWHLGDYGPLSLCPDCGRVVLWRRVGRGTSARRMTTLDTGNVHYCPDGVVA